MRKLPIQHTYVLLQFLLQTWELNENTQWLTVIKLTTLQQVSSDVINGF